MIGRIQQDGFVSEYEYQELQSGDQKIFYLVTGHLVRLKDDPKALFLFDDNARLFHSIDKVSFLHRVSNTIEGEKLYPRPFITDQTDDEKKITGYKFGSKIISTGDKVIISYVNGSIFNPLVIGSIEPFGSFYQNDFLLTKPEEWEQEKKRLENDDYTFEYKDDSHGEITLSITAKEKDSQKKNQGGTGNITINLVGTDGNGKITLNLSGDAAINQKDKDGSIKQSITMNMKDGGIKIKGKTDGKEEYTLYGDTTKQKLSDLIDAILALVFQTNTGATLGLIPTSMQQLNNIKSKLDEILVD